VEEGQRIPNPEGEMRMAGRRSAREDPGRGRNYFITTYLYIDGDDEQHHEKDHDGDAVGDGDDWKDGTSHKGKALRLVLLIAILHLQGSDGPPSLPAAARTPENRT
jgi:hypothetical protein